MVTERIETKWAVKFLNDPRYPKGYISIGHTHPSGYPAIYDERWARNDTVGNKDRVLMKRTVKTITSDWEEAE